MITGKNIFEYAEDLRSKLELFHGTNKEVCIRNIIAKCYYAVYHLVHENGLVDVTNFEKNHSFHKQTKEYLKKVNPRLFSRFSSLHMERKRADYVIEDPYELNNTVHLDDIIEDTIEAIEIIESMSKSH